jgi:lipoprotein-releasing system permease protein
MVLSSVDPLVFAGMYKLQLIRKYLLKRRIAWVALVAVMLCTAMVLIVVSVMGGWLKSFEGAFHGMTGDVVIAADSPLGGFPYYQEMIDGVRKLPDVQAAVPIIHTGAMLNVGRQVRLVELYGYPPDIGDVIAWPTSLHLNTAERKKQLQDAINDPAVKPERRQWLQKQLDDLPFGLHPDLNYKNFVFGSPAVRAAALNRPGIIISGALAGIRSDKSPDAQDRRDNLYGAPVTLTVVPVKGDQPINTKEISPTGFWIVDDSRSQLWQLDFNNVYISFDQAQSELEMQAGEGVGARCSEVEIKARPGVDLNKLKAEVTAVTDQVRANNFIPYYYDFSVKTWIDQQGTFIKAVQNEVVLTTLLFSIISGVAVLLIFCMFYMIVLEKTKDIGIIKSVGATGMGILTMFLGYGAAIGLVGALLGLGVAYLLVLNINGIHAWMGRRLGIVIWSPETYQFDSIPNHMEPRTVVYVLVIAVLSALVGALIPAVRAAIMNPVDALRYE